MAFFRVGMRVRLVKPLLVASAAGRQFTIKGFGFWPNNGITRLTDCTVKLDDGGVVAEWQIEPILPPHEPADDAEFIKDLDRLLEKVGEGV